MRALAFVFVCASMGVFAAQSEIRFQRGRNSATVSGSVTEFNDTYTFGARKGQSMQIALTPAGGDKGTLTLSVSGYCQGNEYASHALLNEVIRGESELPCTGKYSIDVMPSREAAEAKRVQRYSLTLTIR